MPEPRGMRPNFPAAREKVGLPVRPFFYSLEQIAALISVRQKTLETSFIFYDGRSSGAMSVHLMLARNIAHPTEKPIWRVAEREFIRWLKLKGYKVYEAGVVTY